MGRWSYGAAAAAMVVEFEWVWIVDGGVAPRGGGLGCGLCTNLNLEPFRIWNRGQGPRSKFSSARR